MSSSTLTDKKRLLPILWNTFLEKIDREWDSKYQFFGKSREEIHHRVKFAEAVTKDMAADAQKRRPEAKVKLFNHLTLHNYFNANGWPQKVQPKTLLIFLRYLGYDDWKAFANDHPQTSLREAPFSPNDTSSISRDGRNWLFFGPIIALAVAFGYLLSTLFPIHPLHSNDTANANILTFLPVATQQKTLSEQELLQFMRQAMQMEYDVRVRRDLTKDDLNALHQYFLPHSAAAERITNDLERYKEKGAKINPINSTFSVDSINILSQNHQFIALESYEFWSLSFEYPNSESKHYEQASSQKYYLAIGPNGPQIVINFYGNQDVEI